MTDNTVPAPDPRSGLEAGRKAEDAVWNRPGVDDLSGSRLHALERRADAASAAAEITVAAGGGQFRLHLSDYDRTYRELYDLHKRLEDAAAKANAAANALSGLSQEQPGGRLGSGDAAWRGVCTAAENVGLHADYLNNEVKDFLWAMHHTKIGYKTSESKNSVAFVRLPGLR